MNLAQLAEYVQRHPQLIRERYMHGDLPEPAYSKFANGRTQRRWTLSEAEAIKVIFAHVKWGTFARKRVRRLRRS